MKGVGIVVVVTLLASTICGAQAQPGPKGTLKATVKGTDQQFPAGRLD